MIAALVLCIAQRRLSRISGAGVNDRQGDKMTGVSRYSLHEVD